MPALRRLRLLLLVRPREMLLAKRSRVLPLVVERRFGLCFSERELEGRPPSAESWSSSSPEPFSPRTVSSGEGGGCCALKAL